MLNRIVKLQYFSRVESVSCEERMIVWHPLQSRFVLNIVYEVCLVMALDKKKQPHKYSAAFIPSCG